jgi:putative sterol carrier protein
MSVKAIFSGLIEKMNANPVGIKGIQTVYQFDISGSDAGTYQVKVEGDQAQFVVGTPFSAKAIFQLSDQDFHKLINRSLNPTTAFMMGKIKVKGDLGAAMKLQSILKSY